jgi:hypothetical protein
MGRYTSESVCRAVLDGRYGDVGLEPPLLRRRSYLRALADALSWHDIDPLADPEELARREGFHVGWLHGERCGVHSGNLILAPYVQDPRERGWVVTHERTHGAVARLRLEHNETDVVLASCDFAIPAWLRGEPRAQLATHLPLWLIRTLTGRRAA